MFIYASPGEGLAWLEASVEDLAEFDALTFAAAKERREGGSAPDAATT